MPKEAKVAVFEDDAEWRELIREKLEEAGHEVVGEAKTLEESLALIKRFEEMRVNVAVLGGNLGDEVLAEDDPENDSQVLLRAMSELGLLEGVNTVGLSGIEVPGTTVDLGKTRAGELGRVVTALR